MVAITGASSNEKVFNMMLRIPSGPLAFLSLIDRKAMSASCNETYRSAGISDSSTGSPRISSTVSESKSEVRLQKKVLTLSHSDVTDSDLSMSWRRTIDPQHMRHQTGFLLLSTNV